MLDKEIFKKTEGQLYGYFRDLKEIELLGIDCRDLQDQENNIKWNIEHCNVHVSPDSHMSPSFSERVQTSPTGEGVAEKGIIQKGIIREIEKLEDELEYVSGKLRRNRARIRQLKRNIDPLKKVLTVPPLSKEMMDFITYKYKLDKSINWIANEMYGGVRSTAYRKREEILENIIQWSNMYGDS